MRTCAEYAPQCMTMHLTQLSDVKRVLPAIFSQSCKMFHFASLTLLGTAVT